MMAHWKSNNIKRTLNDSYSCVHILLELSHGRHRQQRKVRMLCAVTVPARVCTVNRTVSEQKMWASDWHWSALALPLGLFLRKSVLIVARTDTIQRREARRRAAAPRAIAFDITPTWVGSKETHSCAPHRRRAAWCVCVPV